MRSATFRLPPRPTRDRASRCSSRSPATWWPRATSAGERPGLRRGAAAPHLPCALAWRSASRSRSVRDCLDAPSRPSSCRASRPSPTRVGERQPARRPVSAARRLREQPAPCGQRLAVDAARRDEDVPLRARSRARRACWGAGGSSTSPPRRASPGAAIWPEHLPLLTNPDHQESPIFFLAGSVLYVNRDVIPLRGAGVIAPRRPRRGAELDRRLPASRSPSRSPTPCCGWASPSARACRTLRPAGTCPTRPTSSRSRSPSCGSRRWARLALARAGLTTATVLPLAYCSWRLVEAPALRLKGRLVPAKLTGRSVIVPPASSGERRGVS